MTSSRREEGRIVGVDRGAVLSLHQAIRNIGIGDDDFLTPGVDALHFIEGHSQGQDLLDRGPEGTRQALATQNQGIAVLTAEAPEFESDLDDHRDGQDQESKEKNPFFKGVYHGWI